MHEYYTFFANIYIYIYIYRERERERLDLLISIELMKEIDLKLKKARSSLYSAEIITHEYYTFLANTSAQIEWLLNILKQAARGIGL